MAEQQAPGLGSITERRNIADSRFRDLVQSLQDYAIFLLNEDGRVLTWNAGARGIKGYEPDEIVGQHFSRFYLPEDVAAGKPEAMLRKALAVGSAREEGWRLRKDGSRFWADVVVTPQTDEAGKLVGFAKVTRDLTERHTMLSTLALQSALVDTVGEGVMLGREVDQQIIYANKTAHMLLGYPPGTLVGRSISVFVPADAVRLNTMPELFAAFRRGEVVSLEAERLRADGSRFWARVSLSQFPHPEHGVLRLVSFHDISDRKQAEFDLKRAHDDLEEHVARRTADLTQAIADLREEGARRAEAERLAERSESRFARLSESGLIGTFVSSVTGTIIEANQAFLDMVGYSQDDVREGILSWHTLTPPDGRAENDRIGDELARRGFAGPWEKEYQHRDGTRVAVLVGVARLEEAMNISFVIDISQRRLAEKNLRRTEEQLRQSQKMEAIGRLAGGIAHDFNNALSVILSYAELIRRQLPPNDPMRQDIEDVQTGANRAANLTRQLLLFSRQQPSQPRELDLNELLGNMDRMLQRVLGEDIALTSRPGKDIGRIRIDPGYVEQVIMNLVVNARDAMPQGGQLTIETSTVEVDAAFSLSHAPVKPGRYVRLAVTDTGMGMDAATRERIFEPFFTTKPVGQGTGLGLSTVFGIVQQAEGFIWVYSEPGRGTTFKVYLPRVDAAPHQRAGPVHVGPVTGAETILVVEDEESLRRVVCAVLRSLGYTVFEATNGTDALKKADEAPTLDLLLTDVVLPLMGGPELAKRMREKRPALKVLCMSGYTDDSVVRHGLLDATFPFLQKPLTPDSLANRVREVLDGSRAEASQRGVMVSRVDDGPRS